MLPEPSAHALDRHASVVESDVAAQRLQRMGKAVHPFSSLVLEADEASLHVLEPDVERESRADAAADRVRQPQRRVAASIARLERLPDVAGVLQRGQSATEHGVDQDVARLDRELEPRLVLEQLRDASLDVDRAPLAPFLDRERQVAAITEVCGELRARVRDRVGQLRDRAAQLLELESDARAEFAPDDLAGRARRASRVLGPDRQRARGATDADAPEEGDRVPAVGLRHLGHERHVDEPEHGPELRAREIGEPVDPDLLVVRATHRAAQGSAMAALGLGQEFEGDAGERDRLGSGREPESERRLEDLDRWWWRWSRGRGRVVRTREEDAAEVRESTCRQVDVGGEAAHAHGADATHFAEWIDVDRDVELGDVEAGRS